MLQIGDGLDGSGVAAFERVPLLGEATHDICASSTYNRERL